MNPSIILDTDIGYDPDDLFALIFLHKLAGERLKLLVTANEVNGKRAKFAKQVLNSLNNSDTKVVEGLSLGSDKFTVDSLLAKTQDTFEKDFLSAMKQVVDDSESVIYIGIGGFTNLARFIEAFPDQARKLKIFLMGGALNYERHPGWVEYNVRIDPPSARKVIESGCDISFIMAQTTHNPILEVNATHPLYTKLLSKPDETSRLLREHCRLWFEEKGHGTLMHDPLTVAAALGYEFVNFYSSKIVLDEAGGMHENNSGHLITWSKPDSRADEFMRFLSEVLNK